MIRIERNPSRRQLLTFGISWPLVFALLGGLAWWKTGSPNGAATLWAVGAIPAIGLVWPGGLRLFYVLVSYVTFPIGFVASYLILAVIYYLVLTPTGLILRLRGHDPMQRRFDRNVKTYWTPREEEDAGQRCFRQF
jgi:hypothetical protein